MRLDQLVLWCQFGLYQLTIEVFLDLEVDIVSLNYKILEIISLWLTFDVNNLTDGLCSMVLVEI